MDSARAHLETLASIESSVELGPVGFAAVTTEACRAFQALSGSPDALARLEPELERLTQEGSPAAIVYAALLLRRAGRDVAPLVARYADDRRPCTLFPGGCMSTSHWLCEAVRWVSHGEHWSHPERLLAHELDQLEFANWFELPSPALLEAVREQRRRDGQMASGHWVFTFAELFVFPARLRAHAAKLETLLAHPRPHVGVYAALLLRALDRAAGDRAFATLATSRSLVTRLEDRWWGWRPTREVPITALLAELERWPA